MRETMWFPPMARVGDGHTVSHMDRSAQPEAGLTDRPSLSDRLRAAADRLTEPDSRMSVTPTTHLPTVEIAPETPRPEPAAALLIAPEEA